MQTLREDARTDMEKLLEDYGVELPEGFGGKRGGGLMGGGHGGPMGGDSPMGGGPESGGVQPPSAGSPEDVGGATTYEL
jgi:hypothetical protein